MTDIIEYLLLLRKFESLQPREITSLATIPTYVGGSLYNSIALKIL